MMTSLSEVRTLTLTVYGTAFGDNSGAIELAKIPKMYPRAKHFNPKNTISEHMGGYLLVLNLVLSHVHHKRQGCHQSHHRRT
jgi:hypothetical protein